jgi:hypothetical protein
MEFAWNIGFFIALSPETFTQTVIDCLKTGTQPFLAVPDRVSSRRCQTMNSSIPYLHTSGGGAGSAALQRKNGRSLRRAGHSKYDSPDRREITFLKASPHCLTREAINT